jgi:hypothetical protein
LRAGLAIPLRCRLPAVLRAVRAVHSGGSAAQRMLSGRCRPRAAANASIVASRALFSRPCLQCSKPPLPGCQTFHENQCQVRPSCLCSSASHARNPLPPALFVSMRFDESRPVLCFAPRSSLRLPVSRPVAVLSQWRALACCRPPVQPSAYLLVAWSLALVPGLLPACGSRLRSLLLTCLALVHPLPV